MRLKRGAERESCDFCHRRKIKCDRAARAADGVDGCSACARREIPCVVDDANDVRLQRRRGQSEALQPSSKRARTATEVPPALPEADVVERPAAAPVADPGSGNTLFDLNPESIFFLDQVFMGDLTTGWTDDMQTGLFLDLLATDVRPEDAAMEHYQNLWNECDVSSDIFAAAIRAYFDYATLCLPITFEDAFWKDVETNTASAALVCAVACRGMPFVEDDDKWATQQRIAKHFKKTFLEQQQHRSGQTRLDDVEALALMVGFRYEEDAVNGLEGLFLSHDALVLMALQLRSSSKEANTLSRAAERHSLLFWHVYGLDAFACLDKKTASRIPETQPTLGMPDTGSGYLDAVLSLAVIVRKMIQKLGGAGRQVVRSADVGYLYDQLQAWKDTSCPARLRYGGNNANNNDYIVQLHRLVLHMLHVNCCMQIESWVEEHGTTVVTLADEMMAPRIEFESLRALNEGLKAAKELQNNDFGLFSLVDLSPNIVRNVCVGLGVWTCLRGRKRLTNQTNIMDSNYQSASVQQYLDAVDILRAAAAKAKSHGDTPALLSALDQQVQSLTECTIPGTE